MNDANFGLPTENHCCDSLVIEVGPEILFRNVTVSLSENRSYGAHVQLVVQRHRQGLLESSRRYASQFYMTASGGMNDKPEFL